jgi:hypothetical protein
MATYLRTAELPLGQLVTYPGNARRGSIPVIRESIRANDQYRSLVVREHETGGRMQHTMLAGNHTREALALEGRTTARCEIISCSDAEARRINMIDNRGNDLASWDTDALTAQLDAFEGDLGGTGWTADQVAKFTRTDVPEDDGAPLAQRFELVVELPDQPAQAKLFDRLTAEGFTCRVLTL